MLDPQKIFEREALLKRIRELDAEIVQHERNLWEFEAQLPIEEQLRLELQRFIGNEITELDSQDPNTWNSLKAWLI